jgi:hypothetical protein
MRLRQRFSSWVSLSKPTRYATKTYRIEFLSNKGFWMAQIQTSRRYRDHHCAGATLIDSQVIAFSPHPFRRLAFKSAITIMSRQENGFGRNPNLNFLSIFVSGYQIAISRGTAILGKYEDGLSMVSGQLRFISHDYPVRTMCWPWGRIGHVYQQVAEVG